MRSEISKLIVPHIYPNLIDRESVHKYPHIKGMSNDVYFYTHNYHEYKPGNSKSFVNYTEANFAVALAQHLIDQQGYQPSQITILSTYKSQVELINYKIRLAHLTDKVRVSTADGYQGEENDIIILSIVRSNNRNQIGFLKTNNRICVALSRAKHGLYVLCNLELLSQQSPLWTGLNEYLRSTDHHGPITESPIFQEMQANL